MGGCASKPKECEILETSATTEKAVGEAVSQEKADEIVAEKKEESAGDGADTQKDAEQAEAEPEPAPEEVVKTAAAKEAAIETAENKKASGETEPPKQEEANDTKTNEEPLVTL